MSDLETVDECPVCSNSQFKPFVVCKDYLVSKQDFAIQECIECGFRITNPRPDKKSIGNYYQSQEYTSHNDNSTGLINSVYRLVRGYTLKSKLNLINELNAGAGRILDVGCGTGAFLETCKSAGWAITGMEPDENARSVAQQKLSAAIQPDLIKLTKESPFDIITLWHVLEHITDLNETIEKLSHMLATKGSILIAVPNSASFDAQYFNEYWAAYDVPRHVHHFVPSSIETLFEKHGLKLVAKKPMKFDAFYIAMLSTRYKTGKTDYLESIRVGLRSNNDAKRTGNWSSVIYVLKKQM